MRPEQQNNDHVGMINPNTYNSLYGLAMQQSWQDLVLWEWFLNRVRVKSIVELGTGNAAFSCFLQTQCISRGLQFATVDIHKPDQRQLHRVLGIPRVFIEIDLLGPGAISMVERLLNGLPRPVVLYCDNGDKPHEVAVFSNLLKKRDYLGVHDYGIEFHDHHLDPIKDRVVEVVKPEEAIGNTRWYEVIK